jgi:hypothetical protein
MEQWGVVSLFLGGAWFVLNNFLTGYRDFKKDIRDKYDKLSACSNADHCTAQHLQLKEDIINTLYK